MPTNPALLSRFLRKSYVGEIETPEPESHEIQIKTVSVALNPTDFKLPPLTIPGGKIVGCDYGGVVTKVGDAVTKFKPGDRVFGVVHGSNSYRTGAFSEYFVMNEGLVGKCPDNLPLQKACTVGVSFTTSILVLHEFLGYQVPGFSSGKGFLATSKSPLLIWSAGTATGQMLIQIAKAFDPSIKIVTTSSPQHFDKLKSLGADSTFDYRHPNVVSEVRKEFGDSILRAFDCYSEGNSSKLTASCMSEAQEGFLCRSLPYLHLGVPRNIKHDYVFAYTAEGVAFRKLFLYWKAVPEHLALAKFCYDNFALDWLSSGQVKTPPTTEVQNSKGGVTGALEAIKDDGLEQLRLGKVRGSKLVVSFADDPIQAA